MHKDNALLDGVSTLFPVVVTGSEQVPDEAYGLMGHVLPSRHGDLYEYELVHLWRKEGRLGWYPVEHELLGVTPCADGKGYYLILPDDSETEEAGGPTCTLRLMTATALLIALPALLKIREAADKASSGQGDAPEIARWSALRQSIACGYVVSLMDAVDSDKLIEVLYKANKLQEAQHE